MKEQGNAFENTAASVVRGAGASENASAWGEFNMKCYGKDGELKWEETFPNAVTTEGKTAALQHFLKGSAYTAALRMGLIGNVSYTAPDAADVASAINTAASANNWNEAAASVCATRGTPTVGTPSAGSVTFSAQAFSIIGTDTINGVFLLMKSFAGVDPTSTVGNTSGALWSCGALSVAKAVTNGDTLNVTYTTGL